MPLPARTVELAGRTVELAWAVAKGLQFVGAWEECWGVCKKSPSCVKTRPGLGGEGAGPPGGWLSPQHQHIPVGKWSPSNLNPHLDFQISELFLKGVGRDLFYLAMY